MPDRFLIPQRLYGRNLEISTLIDTFEATCRGERSLLLVSGYSGIGKTSLISEMYRRILRARGYFVNGKFDQVVRSIPYGALIQALNSLVRQWLAQSEERVAAWRTELSKALGSNAGVLAEVIPELELVLGKQPSPAPLDPAEAQNRFRYVFQSFVETVASADHPLVLFLDDLQWVDSATLELLSSLLTGPEIHHLLVIGAYRDTELDAGHLLPWTIERLEASGAPVRRVSLGPLALQDVVTFLEDTLHSRGEEIESLARLILQKTDGNPFFVIQFLSALERDRLFVFDHRRRCWTFDIDQIAAAGLTDNVIDLMTRRIRKLTSTSQSALMVAACIGNPFGWETFVTASRLSADEAAGALAEWIEAGLVHVAEGSHDTSDGREGTLSYAFLHDRVQQAAYELIPEPRRHLMHLEVGRLLRKGYRDDVPEDRVFEVVSHLNIGSSEIDSPAERLAVARLNLAAGRKAKLSTAYEAAASHFDAGIGLLPAGDWVPQYDLMFALHLESAECHYLAGHFDVAERNFEVLLEQSASATDKAQVHTLRIVLYENLSRFADAISSGREGLALFAISLPDTAEATQTAIDREIESIAALLGGRRIASLLELPVMEDGDIRMVMRILTSLWAPSYLSGHQLLTRLISATMVRLSLLHGNTEDSAYGYVTHAITIGPVRGDFASAYEWGELALRVNERFGDATRRAKIQQQFHAHVKLWRRPFDTCIPHAREARRSGLESGDFTYAGYAAVSESWPALLVSRSLDLFVREYSSAFALLERIRMADFQAALRVVVNWARALQGRTANPVSLSDATFDEAAFVSKYELAAPFFLTFYYVARLSLCVLHARYAEGVALARRAREVAVVGTIWPVLIDFWGSLAMCGAWSAEGDETRRDFTVLLDESEESLAALAASCPENFRCFSLIVAGARQRARGELQGALKLFDEAIAFARETSNVQMEALASELAADTAQAAGDSPAAAVLRREAHRRYVQWGAMAKARQLELTEGTIDEDRLRPADPRPTEAGDAAALDLATVLKVAHAISVEIELDGLLRKLMKIALENAGAARSVFIQDRGGVLTIEAEALADRGDVRLRLGAPCDEGSDLALSVVRYVRRTGQDVVLADAGADERFSSDPYVARTGARSVVCVPVAHQGRTTGILYLENNLTTDAFTPSRTEMLRILAAQAAISLENARLYDDMKAEIERRTAAETSLREALGQLQVLQHRLEAENVYLQEEIRTQHNFNEIVGNSPPLIEALRRVELVAPTESTVLILGETGSGKELFARALHGRSRRRNRPLVKVNCGAIAPGLVESELFGHVKGAFTGAIDKRVGRFEVANGGTIFLDEVGELPLDAQVKLLRVLQEQEFEPVGSSRTVKVDVRVIAATNRNLEQAVREGSFRADLLYRLNVFPIEVPALRERKSDIPLLAGLFVSGLSRKLGKPLQGFTTRSMQQLMEYSWPGNVRELQNLVERAAIVATGPVLELDRSFAVDQPRPAAPARTPDRDTLDSVQRAHIVAVLKSTGGVVEGRKGAASILGMHPNTLRSRMKKLGITAPKSVS